MFYKDTLLYIMKTENLQDTSSLGVSHWIIMAIFGLSLLYGIGYGTINIILTGGMSNTLLWFLPLSGVMALFAWGYVRNGKPLSEMINNTDGNSSIADRVFRWTPLVFVGYVFVMYYFLPAKVQRAMWTDDFINYRNETIYLMGYDMISSDGSATRHYLQAGEHYLANETPFAMVIYEVLYGKDDGRELECKRFEPYSIDIGEKGTNEAPKYNVPDNEWVNYRYHRGNAKRETYVEKYQWFERGKKHITLQGLYPYSTLIIARSSYTPDVVVKDIANGIVVSNSIDAIVQGYEDVTDTYYKALGKRSIP